MPIERVPRFAEDRNPKSPYDCTIIAALQAELAGTRVQNCGLLPIDASAEARARAAACMIAAVAARRPVLLAQEQHGVDSAVASAYVARTEGSTYVGYLGTKARRA